MAQLWVDEVFEVVEAVGVVEEWALCNLGQLY